MPVEAFLPMSEPDSTPLDPLGGSAVAAYWIYGFDMPDEAGGGFVTGELLLRSDGVLLRRPTQYTTTPEGGLKPGFGPWEEVPWWNSDVTDPHNAAGILHYRGYDLHRRDPADPDQPRRDENPS
jgi:hypothetical protein